MVGHPSARAGGLVVADYPWVSEQLPVVAVVGAGIAGLSAARRLSEHGCQVRVFEKSRGLGGRCATRRAGELSFDHGAQYFTVREIAWADVVAAFQDQGLVAPWRGRLIRLRADGTREPAGEAERYVGVPGMSTIGRALAQGVDALCNTRVTEVGRGRSGAWQLRTSADEAFDGFAAVLLTCPAPQAADLLNDASPALAASCASATMQPCWAVMATFGTSLGLEFDAAFVDDDLLSWAARNSSKPGRPAPPEAWVLHGGPEWSAHRQSAEARDVARELLDRFFTLTGCEPRVPEHVAAHHWRYARSADPSVRGPLVNPELRIGVAGDWARGDRLEAAFLSGLETADALLAPPIGPAGKPTG